MALEDLHDRVPDFRRSALPEIRSRASVEAHVPGAWPALYQLPRILFNDWHCRAPASQGEEHADKRMQALILLCAHGGLRISEVLAVRSEDVSLDGRELTVRYGKGGKQRRVVIGEILIRALRRLPEQQSSMIGGSYPAAIERLRRLCLRAGVAYRGYHALRHYAGTRLTREGASLDDVARHLGHSVLETARIYAKWSDESLRRRVGQW